MALVAGVFVFAGSGALAVYLIQGERRSAIERVCDLESIFRDFVEANPKLPRDKPALDRLNRLEKEQKCEELLPK